MACLGYAAVKRVGAQDRVCGVGEGICSVFRMNPVLADHLRAHSAEVRGGRVCLQRLKESTAAPSWNHSQSCLLAAAWPAPPKARTTRSA